MPPGTYGSTCRTRAWCVQRGACIDILSVCFANLRHHDPPTTIQDVLISAPQKGWSGPACCALVMLSERARAVALDDKSQPANNSFCCNLRQWIGVMDEYDAGRCKYYTTLPTDALVRGTNRSHVYCPRQPFRCRTSRPVQIVAGNFQPSHRGDARGRFRQMPKADAGARRQHPQR